MIAFVGCSDGRVRVASARFVALMISLQVAMLNCANIGIQCCLDIHSMPITKVTGGMSEWTVVFVTLNTHNCQQVHALKSHNCFSIAFDNFCGHGLMQVGGWAELIW